MKFSKIILYVFLILSIIFFFRSFKEFRLIQQAETISFRVTSKACYPRYSQKISASYNGVEYVVSVTKEFCGSISENEIVSGYYCAEMDKIFISKERNISFIVVGSIGIIVSLILILKYR